MSTPVTPTPIEHENSSGISLRLFLFLLLLLVGGAVVRSAIATRLDGFTIDEAYHIAAGVSYVRYADFRINPEHPPLVKLWVGSFIAATGFELSSIRPFADKADERDFAEEDVYLHNDFNSVQRRARIAMWTLNGLLLVALTFAVRGAFGGGLALGTLLFLAIDPTVAAHLPVVMTDLPVSLLSATAVVLAIRAFRYWEWKDLLACSAALGLALATKHSAPVFLIFVVLSGALLALLLPVWRAENNSRSVRFAKVTAVAAGALIILWGFYFFRFAESNTGREVFNRPLANKIADVHSPVYRFVLDAMASSHVVPRAYIWGFADTIRAGLEGRADPITAFGRPYFGTGPRYFFPGMIALKLPIGLSVLVLIGLFLFFARRIPPEWNAGLGIVLMAAGLFLLVLASGFTYAGIRHALPVVVLLAIPGGLAVHAALSSNSKWLIAGVVASVVAAAASALPVMRPWEYFNEVVGPKNAHLYFSDEGVDLWQRGKELAAYYHEVLEPAGEVPLLNYVINEPEEKARHLDWIGRDKQRDQGRLTSPVFTGTILIRAAFLGKRPFWDLPDLRHAIPAARFGNLLVFRGTFNCGGILAPNLYVEAVSKIYAEKPDLQEAERLLRQSVRMDPSEFFADIELGNLCLKRGSREDALQAYSDALQQTPNDRELRRSIEEQIKRVSSDPLGQVPDLRDPFME